MREERGVGGTSPEARGEQRDWGVRRGFSEAGEVTDPEEGPGFTGGRGQRAHAGHSVQLERGLHGAEEVRVERQAARERGSRTSMAVALHLVPRYSLSTLNPHNHSPGSGCDSHLTKRRPVCWSVCSRT